MTTYGPDFNGVVRSVPDRSSAEPENQAEALKPFTTFAKECVEKTETGWQWSSGLHRDRISDWFGPSDFGLLAHFAALASLPEAPAVPVGVTDALIEKALHARVPGGSEVWHWLPQLDGWTPHETARDIIRCALEAALQSSPPVKAAAVDGEEPYQDIDPGEHQEILDALAAHNSGEE
jgi:hypothetical protein